MKRIKSVVCVDHHTLVLPSLQSCPKHIFFKDKSYGTIFTLKHNDPMI